jgi:hypothetical protein
MHALIAALALCSVLSQPPTGRTVTFALPHALRGGETAFLEVSVGVIPRGAEIEITTTSGHPLGTISPYGIRAGHEAGTYTVPLPPQAISGRRVSVLLSLHFAGKQRAPTKKEVKKVRVTISPGK